MNRLRRLLRPVGLVAALLAPSACKKEPPKPSALSLKLADRTVAKVQPQGAFRYPLPYRLFVPPGHDKSKRYPLILYLHHGGNRGDDNLAQLNEELEKLIGDEVQGIEPTVVLAPQCPTADQWVNGAKQVPYQNYAQDKVPESDVAKLTLEVLALVRKEYGIDPARIYVTGSSMGASGTWDYITRYPGIFAAAITINGINDPSRAKVIQALPIWSFHGDKDKVSPVENTRAMVDALRKLGSPIKYTEVAGMGHDGGLVAYGDREAMRWLLAQRLAAAKE